MNILELIEKLQAVAKVHPNWDVAFEVEDEMANFSADIAGVDLDYSRRKVVLE